MTTTNYINSGYITKMGDSSTNDGTAGRPVDSIDYPHSGLIKSLNVMASTGYPVLNANVGSGSHNFNMDMDDTTSSGYTTITVRAGMVIREGVAVSVAQGTITEISSGSPTDVQFIEQGSAGENFYHVIVVNSSNVIKIRNPSAKDKVADLTNGDIPIAVLRVQNNETPTARHLQYLTTDVQSNSISFAYDNSGVYTEMSKITAASGGTTVEVATAGGDFTIDNTDADKKIVMRLGSDDANTDFEVRNNSDAVKFSVDGAGTTDVKSLSLGTAGELTITESSDDITIKNTVSDKDIIFNVNDGGSDTEVMRIKGSNACVGIGTNAPTEMLHLADADGAEPKILIENTGTAGNEPEIVFWRSTGTGADSRDIGHIRFKADDTAGNLHTFAQIYVDQQDADSGTEDGRIIFDVSQAGTDGVEHLRIQGGAVVINDTSANIDFRVEGNNDTHLLYTDGGNDRIGIGLNSPSAKLNLKGLLDESITGTVTTTNGSETITGSGTSFLSELRAGQAIKVGSETRIIHNIASDTSLTVDSTTPFTSGGSGVVSGGNAYIDDDLLIMEDGNGTDILTIRDNSLIGLESGIIQSVRHINNPLHGISSALRSTDRNIIVDLSPIPMAAQDYDFTLNGDNTADIGRIFTIQCVAIGGGAPFEGTGVDIVLSGSDVLKDLDNSVIANSSTRLQIVAGKSYTILQEARNIFRVIHKNV
tara:strand:- start:723 stop:2837 length:2115 start_codon:yes stop_codon:yes gene_type:complete